MTAVGVHPPCSYLFGVVNVATSPVAQSGGCPRALSIEISRFLVEQLEAVEIAIANDRSTSAASYRQTSPECCSGNGAAQWQRDCVAKN